MYPRENYTAVLCKTQRFEIAQYDPVVKTPMRNPMVLILITRTRYHTVKRSLKLMTTKIEDHTTKTPYKQEMHKY